MSSIDSLPIPELYKEVNHITEYGVDGYYVAKKYQDPAELMKSRQQSTNSAKIKRYQTKRGNFLDDQSKLHKFVPGPGKYTYQQQWPKKTKSLHQASKKLTYIDQIMRRQKKQKKPAPGHYNVFKTDKDIQAEKKKLASKKFTNSDKINYLDHIQYQALQSPGAGMYNPRVPITISQNRIQTQCNKLKTTPQDWRKKHQNMQKNKKEVKAPDMRTYNPIPSDYKMFGKQKPNRNLLGKVDRFKIKSTGSGIGPGKYNITQQWRGKDAKIKTRHGLESITKGLSKSVYYN